MQRYDVETEGRDTRHGIAVFNGESVQITRASEFCFPSVRFMRTRRGHSAFHDIPIRDFILLGSQCRLDCVIQQQVATFPPLLFRPRPRASKGLCPMSDHTHAYTTEPFYRARNRGKLLKQSTAGICLASKTRFLRRNVGIFLKRVVRKRMKLYEIYENQKYMKVGAKLYEN